MDIQESVGRGGKNNADDVRAVQLLLQGNMDQLGPSVPVDPSGNCDPQTVALIEMFQLNVVNMRPASGRVDPNSTTLFALNKTSGPSTTTDQTLQIALDGFRSEAANFGQRFIQDGNVRADYVNKATEASEEILAQVQRGELTAAEGAVKANSLRNSLLEAGRINSSDIGRAAAQAEKATGLTMDSLLAKYSTQLFKKDFAALTTAEQDAVFLQVVRAAGRPNPKFTAAAAKFGKAGKGLLIISLAVAVYSVAESDRPEREAAKQGVGLGVGFLGSLAGGAAAGLVCGPGAPICVGVGVFVGGLLFAVGSDFAFDSIWE